MCESVWPGLGLIGWIESSSQLQMEVGIQEHRGISKESMAADQFSSQREMSLIVRNYRGRKFSEVLTSSFQHRSVVPGFKLLLIQVLNLGRHKESWAMALFAFERKEI